jgi:hypothetical protein
LPLTLDFYVSWTRLVTWFSFDRAGTRIRTRDKNIPLVRARPIWIDRRMRNRLEGTSFWKEGFIYLCGKLERWLVFKLFIVIFLWKMFPETIKQ